MNTNLRDTSLTVTKAFPAAAANNDSSSISVGGGDDYARRNNLEIVVELPANSILVEAKTIIVTPQMSSDDADADAFVRIPQLSAITITGITGNGMPEEAGSGYELTSEGNLLLAWPCPRYMEEYVRVNVAVLTAGGDLTGLEYTLSIEGL